MAVSITLLEKIKATLEMKAAAGGTLEIVKWVDYGSILPPLSSTYFPLIFLTIESSVHPIRRATRNQVYSYTNDYKIYINIIAYILKSSYEGYKAAFREVCNLVKPVITICHENKEWGDLAYTSEVAEEEDIEWGVTEYGDDIVYSVSIPIICRDIQS